VLKLVVVVDDDIHIFDVEQVYWALATRVQAEKQVQILKGIRGSILDPSIRETVEHDAVIINATKPLGLLFEEKISVPKEYMDKIKQCDFAGQTKKRGKGGYKMKKKGFRVLVLSAVVVISILLLSFTQAPAAEVIRWIGQVDHPRSEAPFGPFKMGYVGVAAPSRVLYDWLTKATNGRLVIDWADVGAICPPTETIDLVSRGVIQIAHTSGLYHSGKIPESDIASGLVFAHTNGWNQWDCLYNYGLYEELKKVYAKRNINYFPLFMDSIFNIGATFPLDKPERIKGKKIRAPGQFGDYIAALGGIPVPLPLAEVYMALKLGTVDGFVSGLAMLASSKWQEVTKYAVGSPSLSPLASILIINMDAFKALPKDIQELFERDLPYVSFGSAGVFHMQNEWVVANAAKQYGVKFYTWSPEDMKRVTELVVEKVWPKIAAKTPECAKMVEIIKKQLRDYGRIP
jgi:TRAP-type C4-dicarboxylate transport system substrate-binding protein